MDGKTWTEAFLLIWIIAAGAWDLFAGLKWGRQATISLVMGQWAHDWPIVALALGVILGHVFWWQHK
jgi:hypothetical protein